MVLTPWGDADTLRQRRLPPGRGGDRAAARREQRERLFAAIVASCEAKGFDATSVEDLLRTCSRASGKARLPTSPASRPSSPTSALAPFVGAEEALEVATSRGRTG